MKFPAANISLDWDENGDYSIYSLEDQYIYTADYKVYQEYYLNQLFVDSNGDVYKIIDRKLPNQFRQILSFIPNLCKVELIFMRTGNIMSLEELRRHFLSQIEKLESNEHKTEWIDKVKNAKSYEEIIVS